MLPSTFLEDQMRRTPEDLMVELVLLVLHSSLLDVLVSLGHSSDVVLELPTNMDVSSGRIPAVDPKA